jgi:hypothetical protein
MISAIAEWKTVLLLSDPTVQVLRLARTFLHAWRASKELCFFAAGGRFQLLQALNM